MPKADGVYGHEEVSYSVRMTTKGTKGRVVRIDEETWVAYGELCAAEGTNRADDLRRHAHARVAAWKKQRDRDAAPRTAQPSEPPKKRVVRVRRPRPSS